MYCACAENKVPDLCLTWEAAYFTSQWQKLCSVCIFGFDNMVSQYRRLLYSACGPQFHAFLHWFLCLCTQMHFLQGQHHFQHWFRGREWDHFHLTEKIFFQRFKRVRAVAEVRNRRRVLSRQESCSRGPMRASIAAAVGVSWPGGVWSPSPAVCSPCRVFSDRADDGGAGQHRTLVRTYEHTSRGREQFGSCVLAWCCGKAILLPWERVSKVQRFPLS